MRQWIRSKIETIIDEELQSALGAAGHARRRCNSLANHSSVPDAEWGWLSTDCQIENGERAT